MSLWIDKAQAGLYTAQIEGKLYRVERIKGKWVIDVLGARIRVFDTLREADRFLRDMPVPTTSLMNPNAGTIMIRAELKGGCCDPGTETYWSM